MFQEIPAILQMVNSIIVFFLWPEALRRITRKIAWTHLHRESLMGPSLKHLPSADELRELDVCYIMGSHAYDFIHNTKDPAPELLTLSLSAEMPRLVDEDGHPASHFIVPTDIFSGTVPNLTQLELRNIAISADSPLLLANLTELNLGRSRGSFCPRSFSLPVLIDILRRMPRMQTLAADDILTEPADASSLEAYLARVPKVSLPDLVCLRIHSPFLLNYRGLPRQLELKDPSRLHLDMSTSIDSFAALDEPLLPHYIASTSIDSPPIRALSIQSNARQTFTLSGWRAPVHTIQPRYNETFRAQVKLGRSSTTTEGISSFCAQLPMRMVETLCINWFSFEGRNPLNWAALLQSMDQLKRITIGFGHESEAILGALKRPVNDDSGKLSLLCPKLTALGFPWTSKYSPQLETSSVFLQMLADTLEMRLKHGLKLEELLVGEETITCGDDSGLKVLRERVGQLCPDRK